MWNFTRLFLEVNPDYANWLHVWWVSILAGILAGLLYFIYVKPTLARLENAGSEFLVESPEVLAIMTRLQMESAVDQLSSEQLMKTLHDRRDPAAFEDVNSLAWIKSQAARFDKLAPTLAGSKLDTLWLLLLTWAWLLAGGWLDRNDSNNEMSTYMPIMMFSMLFLAISGNMLRTPIWRYLLPEEILRRLEE